MFYCVITYTFCRGAKDIFFYFCIEIFSFSQHKDILDLCPQWLSPSGTLTNGNCCYSFSQNLWLISLIRLIFLKTISLSLWTVSFLFTLDLHFLLIWANCMCFGTCVQKIMYNSQQYTQLLKLVDQNWLTDYQWNSRSLQNFRTFFSSCCITCKMIHSFVKIYKACMCNLWRSMTWGVCYIC